MPLRKVLNCGWTEFIDTKRGLGMAKTKYILALDQGTTSSRALIVDRDGNIGAVAQKEFRQIFPKSGWVEHDPNEIWSSQAGVAAEAMAKMNIDGSQIAAIGITNQRETAIVWDRKTGEPVYNAIVWQDRRTSAFCDELKKAGLAEKIRHKTGLVLDAYFSATKVRWILDHVPGARQRAQAGELAFGTVDSWLVWKLTDGRVHATDISNASRTLLFNIHEQKWDEELCTLFDVPPSMLPEVKSCSEVVGVTGTAFGAAGIPIAGMAGDQQAAMFGQMCTEEGMIKNTYGTGCFIMMNTGAQAKDSKNNLLTTIAWKLGDQVTYALEGSIFIGGAVVQWLRDGLRCITCSAGRRSARQFGPRQRRRLRGPGVRRTGGPLLGPVRPRRHLRHHPRDDQRPYRPGLSRIDRLPDEGRARCHGRRRRHPDHRAARRWRRVGQQRPDGVPGGPDAGESRPAADAGDHGPGGRVLRGPGRRLLEGPGRDSRDLEERGPVRVPHGGREARPSF